MISYKITDENDQYQNNGTQPVLLKDLHINCRFLPDIFLCFLASQMKEFFFCKNFSAFQLS